MMSVRFRCGGRGASFSPDGSCIPKSRASSSASLSCFLLFPNTMLTRLLRAVAAVLGP